MMPAPVLGAVRQRRPTPPVPCTTPVTVGAVVGATVGVFVAVGWMVCVGGVVAFG
jgi:hypothetical protein